MEINRRLPTYFVIIGTKILEIKEQHIWRIITHYLHKNKELCLYGLGRFAAQSNAFFVDPMAKKIIPAHKKIHFQPGNFEHSPEFLTFCAHLFTCDEVEIVHNLENFINRFTKLLQVNKRIEIENLGVFKYTIIEEIEFESTHQDLFFDNTFGLKPVHFAANLLKTKRIVVETPEEEDLALVEMRESALKELKVLLDNARISESSQPQKNSKAFPIIASVLTLILLANLALFLYKGPVDGLKQQISEMNIAGNATALIDSQQTATTTNLVQQPKTETADLTHAVKKDSIIPEFAVNDNTRATIGSFMNRGNFEFDSMLYTPVIEQSSEIIPPTEVSQAQEIEEELARLPKEPEPNKLVINGSKSKQITEPTIAEKSDLPYMVNVEANLNNIEEGYYVVAGAFKVAENAKKYRDQLLNAGNTSALVFKPSKYPYYLVSFKKNNNLTNALEQLKSKESDYPSIWIYAAQ